MRKQILSMAIGFYAASVILIISGPAVSMMGDDDDNARSGAVVAYHPDPTCPVRKALETHCDKNCLAPSPMISNRRREVIQDLRSGSQAPNAAKPCLTAKIAGFGLAVAGRILEVEQAKHSWVLVKPLPLIRQRGSNEDSLCGRAQSVAGHLSACAVEAQAPMRVANHTQK